MRRQGRNNRRGNAKKERLVMIASSAFVLAALTMTGVYVKQNSEKEKNDGYNINFDTLESKANDKYEEIVQDAEDEILQEEMISEEMAPITEDDLDYTPMEAVDGGSVEIPGLTDHLSGQITTPNLTDILENEGNTGIAGDDIVNSVAEEEEIYEEPVSKPEADFSTGDTLVWPVSGNVLVPYSMDKTVYFKTLDQYKYNPALIVSATEGDTISAAAGGTVKDVYFDEVLGNVVLMDIGNGYTVTYGQLKEIAIEEGDYVMKGNLIGYVAAPTKYYSAEGTNAYFALTLNGEPADPLGKLQ